MASRGHNEGCWAGHAQEDDYDVDLTPKQVVDRLDRYIVGQACGHPHQHVMFMARKIWQAQGCWLRHGCHGSANYGCLNLLQADAKKAVANALRNRWRRRKLSSPMKVRQ